MKRNPNMQDVAREAGVSLMAVSYALRNHPSISAATRERIERIAAGLGYVRRPLVSALMTQVRGRKETSEVPIIAFLSAYKDRASMLSNDFRRSYFDGAARKAEALGFRLEMVHAPARGAKRISDLLKSRNIQAVICGVASLDAPAIPLDWESFASCVIGSSQAYPGHHQVDSNYPQMALLAVERLRALGYEKIGFLCGYFENARVEGAVVSALAGLNFQLSPQRQVRFTILERKDWNAAHVASWVRKHKLDALIIQSHTVRLFLAEAAIRIPEELALATLERTGSCGLAGIDQNPTEIGAAAVELLVDEIYQNHHGLPTARCTLRLDGHWQDGVTAPPKIHNPNPVSANPVSSFNG